MKNIQDDQLREILGKALHDRRRVTVENTIAPWEELNPETKREIEEWAMAVISAYKNETKPEGDEKHLLIKTNEQAEQWCREHGASYNTVEPIMAELYNVYLNAKLIGVGNTLVEAVNDAQAWLDVKEEASHE